MREQSPGHGHPLITSGAVEAERDGRGHCRRGRAVGGQRAVRALGLALACALMAGCGNMRWLENRAVCTLDGKEAHTISKYGPLGIASRLADADAAVLCGR